MSANGELFYEISAVQHAQLNFLLKKYGRRVLDVAYANCCDPELKARFDKDQMRYMLPMLYEALNYNWSKEEESKE